MSKTIKQIAEEIGVSKSAVHQKRKQEPLKSTLHPFTETVNNTVYISDDGETLIKQAFSRDNLKTEEVEEPELSVKLPSSVDTILHTLQGELEAKNKQIESLEQLLSTSQQSVKHLTQALEHAQDSLNKSQALHAGTIQTQLDSQTQTTPPEPSESTTQGETVDMDTGTTPDTSKPSKGFWGRWFKW